MIFSSRPPIAVPSERSSFERLEFLPPVLNQSPIWTWLLAFLRDLFDMFSDDSFLSLNSAS
jgi:hypothetical protein